MRLMVGTGSPSLDQERMHREGGDSEQPGDDGIHHQRLHLGEGQEVDGERRQQDFS